MSSSACFPRRTHGNQPMNCSYPNNAFHLRGDITGSSKTTFPFVRAGCLTALVCVWMRKGESSRSVIPAHAARIGQSGPNCHSRLHRPLLPTTIQGARKHRTAFDLPDGNRSSCRQSWAKMKIELVVEGIARAQLFQEYAYSYSRKNGGVTEQTAL